MIIKTDCRFYLGDRPCRPNKEQGILCDVCSSYSPVTEKILIIKLDAVGDVLRTTSILHAIKSRHKNAHITWLTRSAAAELFYQNNLIDEILFVEVAEVLPRLQTESFSLLINPDASPASAALATYARAENKKGFGMNPSGKVAPFNSEAVAWLEMGTFDQYKKKNRKTYQQIIHEIAGLPYDRGEIVLSLDADEREFAGQFLRKKGVPDQVVLIGLNTGAGGRWQLKQWRLDGYRDLITKLLAEKELFVLLYGGPQEKERNQYLSRSFSDRVIDTGTGNTLRHFFALLDLSDVIVTGDTLALHAATALRKAVVCLFGPTSSAEIEDYGRITKLVPPMECLCCYKPTCDFKPNCMDLISTEMVYDAVMNKVTAIRKTGRGTNQ